ncbi:MAG: aldo/keto reductase [Chloroflexota bacterium]
MTQSNGATLQGTTVYFSRHNTIQSNLLSSTSLKISQVGFGCYRISTGNEQHKKALIKALGQGVNVIDTSTNYADGRSEELVGEVLSQLCSEKKLNREEVVVVSKVGYLQGQNYEMARQRRRQGRPFPNLVKYSQGLDHCIHPEFIEDQLQKSLHRLQLNTIDAYLLHNPEYYLSWAKVATIPQESAQKEYYKRIKLAFEYLETAVSEGKIQWYGISSNTFPLTKDEYTFTSLAKVLEIAESISPEHHFKFIQLPFNLFETGGLTEQNMPNLESTIAYAEANNLTVLINRPLNAFHNDQLIRLADVQPPSYPTTVEEVSTLVDSLVQAEAEFADRWLPILAEDAQTNQQLLEYLALGQMLDGKWQGFETYQNWHQLQAQFFIPRAESAIQFLSQHAKASDDLIDWLNSYVDRFNETLMAVAAFYQEAGAKEALQIQETAVSISADWKANTLSQTAIRALRSTKGVSCTLVGMRQAQYVDDILADLTVQVEVKDRVEAWQKLKTLNTE